MDRKHIRFDLAIPWPRLQWNRDAMRRFLPTPGNVLFTLLMIGLLLWASSAGALPLRLLGPNVPSTNTIAYQGRLADAGGSPLTGAYSIIFRLYNAASGGAPLWEEQWTGQNGVQVSDGLFNVMLGSLTPIPQAVVTGNNTLWLGITVGTDDEMAPRVQLGSVPFAVQALTVPDGSVTTGKIADQAVTGTKLDLVDGNVGIGTTNPVSMPGRVVSAAACCRLKRDGLRRQLDRHGRLGGRHEKVVAYWRNHR
ncbi:MAG: hypothetical protein IPO15_12540 [Anaerolineae bacterium]|uniref:hypothetical protein n=1 Tax=Candidatus Amarolinea dominans TaxID=3140696 RepID=UPI003134A201|nr:hypothetical protein [Anaerolineae bacterium]